MHHRGVRPRIHTAALITILAGLVPGAVRGQEADTTRVVLRFHPTGDEAAQRRVLETLARYLEPKRVEAATGTAVADLVRAECGTATEAHLDMFRRLNAGIAGEVLGRPTTVQIPPCPWWKAEAATVLSERGSVADQVAAVTGIAGPKTLAAVKELNPSLRDRRLSDPASSLAGRTVRLPYASSTTTWALRSQYQARAEEVIAIIGAAPGALAAGVDEGRVTLVSDVTPAGDGASCRTTAPLDLPWPYSTAEVLAVLRHNRAAFQHVAQRPQLPVLVGIGDTGIDERDARLPLHESRERGGRDHQDLDGNGYFHDVVGTYMPERRGFPHAHSGYERRAHGTGVAALAAGGIVPDELMAEVRSRLALKILSIVRRAGDHAPTFSFPEGDIANILSYQSDRRPLAIANLSIQSSTRLENFRHALRSTTALVVIAAGNDSMDLERDPIYPALYREDFQQQVITVASHDPIGSTGRQAIRNGAPDAAVLAPLSRFSNYGRGTIDLAAPGCRIETLGLNSGRVVVDGTSFAAPLVSFTAALLLSEGIMGPERARNRILASVDIVPGLPVHTEGILNIPKALSVFEDLIELRSGEILRGRIVGLTGVIVGGDAFDRERILKIVPPLSRAFVHGPEERLRIRSGSIQLWGESGAIDQIVLRETGTRSNRAIDIRDVADIVLAAPEYRDISPK
jgi:hypothetical protein